jgi:uncharacterized protein (UPF0335 family)
MGKAAETRAGHIAKEQLRLIIERIELLLEEKKAIADDVSDVYAEAKGNGYDPKVIKAIVKRRAADPDELREFEAILEAYMRALGMLG